MRTLTFVEVIVGAAPDLLEPVAGPLPVLTLVRQSMLRISRVRINGITRDTT